MRNKVVSSVCSASIIGSCADFSAGFRIPAFFSGKIDPGPTKIEGEGRCGDKSCPQIKSLVSRGPQNLKENFSRV